MPMDRKNAMKKVRIGQIGTKHDHAKGHMDCIRKFPDVFELVGVVEDDPVQRKIAQLDPSFAECPFLTQEQLFAAECDAVMVEGFELDLPYVAKQCVEKGLHVHMDKPAGDNLEVFEQTLRIAKQKGLTVQMGYMYRYNPAFRECMEMIREGRLGEIHSVTAIMNTGHPLEKRDWLLNFDAGILFFLGCHMIDFVYQIQGVPQKITPYLKSSAIEGSEAIDLATVIFEYDRGTSIIQSNSCEINGFGRRQLVVCGTKGTYEIHPMERPTKAKVTELSYADTFHDCHVMRDFGNTPDSSRYDKMMLDFASFVRGEKQNPYSYEYELQLQKLVLASCGYDVDYKTQVTL